MFHQIGGIIREGDTVIFGLGCFKLLKATMRHGTVLQTKYGAIRHSDFINKLKYGCKYNCARGYVHALSPTPELWTASLLHRTQIIYTPDVSLIVYHLDMRPGSKVIEAGTGSGSLSHAIIRTVAPTGHLYTFDFHEQRSRIAEQEFREHNYPEEVVSCHHRDVCADGFVIDGDNSFKVDAVFLDLPSPWKAIGHAVGKLVPGGKVCVFSPCIEQIQQTAQVMREKGFAYVRTLECIQQRYTVKDFRAPDVPLSKAAYAHSREVSAAVGAKGGRNRGGDQEEAFEEEENAPEENNSEAEDETKVEATNPLTSNGKSASIQQCFFPLTPTPGHTGYLLFGTLFQSLPDQ
jgi:tRNA (adenine57-N1/adenine58-N1)-methyltransferase